MSVVAELRQTDAEIRLHGTRIRMSYPVDLTTRTRNGRCKRVKPETEKRRYSFLARQMALAIKLRGLWEKDTELSFADLARMENLTRARISQIMDLTLLAPDIQREILGLPKRPRGEQTIKESDLRTVCRQPVWEDQRVLWEKIKERASDAGDNGHCP